MVTPARADVRLPQPPFPMPPAIVCEYCGHAAVAFWPGRYVDHGGGVVCTPTAVRQVRRAAA